MDDYQVLPMINYLQSLSGEAMSIALFLLSACIIMVMLRAFGLVGLYVYSVLSTIMANIQVLKLGQLSIFPEPVALGTVTFATVFLTSDIITEHFGKKAAQKSVWLSFSAQIVAMLIMLMTLGFKPVSDHDPAHNAMMALFLPAPRLIIASLLAFIVSQLLEISLFQWISQFNHKKFLWVRTNVSVIVSSFVDNVIFSVVAWVILSPQPVSQHTLIYTYILGTYLIRVVLAVFSTPIMYLSYYFIPRKQ